MQRGVLFRKQRDKLHHFKCLKLEIEIHRKDPPLFLWTHTLPLTIQHHQCHKSWGHLRQTNKTPRKKSQEKASYVDLRWLYSPFAVTGLQLLWIEPEGTALQVLYHCDQTRKGGFHRATRSASLLEPCHKKCKKTYAANSE